MAENGGYDIWLGSELGLLKGVNLSKDTFVNYGNIKTLNKSQSISAMTWQTSGHHQNILIGLKNGVVKTYDTETYQYGSSITCAASPIRGLFALADGTVISCTENGAMQYWKDSQCIVEKKVGDDIRAMVGKASSEMFATGGQGNDLKVWNVKDLDQPIFAAKNVRNDCLNLQVPVWVSAIDFFRNNSNSIAVGSAHHTIRVYDCREKRRPTLNVEWHEHPITSLSMRSGDMSIVAGNSAGYMAELDLRTGKQIGGFKGSCGSIRSIICHVTQQYVAASGLDRFLKVYDLQTRKIVKKIYMKSNLNCMLMSEKDLKFTETQTGEKREHSNEELKDDDETEHVWESMESIEDRKVEKTKKKKR